MTVSERTLLRVSRPVVPVTVNEYVPGATLPTATYNVVPIALGLALNDGLAPFGNPETVNVMGAAAPPLVVTPMVYVAAPPDATDAETGVGTSSNAAPVCPTTRFAVTDTVIVPFDAVNVMG